MNYENHERKFHKMYTTCVRDLSNFRASVTYPSVTKIFVREQSMICRISVYPASVICQIPVHPWLIYPWLKYSYMNNPWFVEFPCIRQISVHPWHNKSRIISVRPWLDKSRIIILYKITQSLWTARKFNTT